MTRRRILVSGLVLIGLLLSPACGGDDGDSDTTEASGDGVDAGALNESMEDFATEVESEFGFFSLPEFQESDQSLLGYLPTGVDAVVFCDRLADFVADQGFEGVTIDVRVSSNGPSLATGVSGEDCTAV